MTAMAKTSPHDCAREMESCTPAAAAAPQFATSFRSILAVSILALMAFACGDQPTSEDAVAAYQGGVAHAQAGRIDAALAELETALRIDETSAPTHLLYAVLQERKGDLGAAEKHLHRLQELAPDDPDAPLHLARILRKRKLDARIDAARKQIVDAGPTTERLIAFGDVLRKRERFDDAQTHYLWAKRTSPPNAAIEAGLGLVYSHNQRQVRALYHLSKALDLDPEASEARDELTWILATSSHDDLRDVSEATRVGEAALAQEPTGSTRLLDAIAAAYAGAGRFQEAQAAARAAMSSAQAAGNHIYAHQVAERIQLYEAGRPFLGPPVDAG
jgi:tetratricopeptide (TPR) repeat protein